MKGRLTIGEELVCMRRGAVNRRKNSTLIARAIMLLFAAVAIYVTWRMAQ